MWHGHEVLAQWSHLNNLISLIVYYKQAFVDYINSMVRTWLVDPIIQSFIWFFFITSCGEASGIGTDFSKFAKVAPWTLTRSIIINIPSSNSDCNSLFFYSMVFREIFNFPHHELISFQCFLVCYYLGVSSNNWILRLVMFDQLDRCDFLMIALDFQGYSLAILQCSHFCWVPIIIFYGHG